jgi:hypothetical protein
MQVSFDEDKIDYLGDSFENGDDCDGEEGVVRFLVNGEEVDGDPSDHKFEDRDVLIIAFAPEDKEIPDLPWASTLDNLSDVGEIPEPVTEPTTETTTAEGDTTETTTAEGDSTDTTTAGEQTDTTAVEDDTTPTSEE